MVWLQLALLRPILAHVASLHDLGRFHFALHFALHFAPHFALKFRGQKFRFESGSLTDQGTLWRSILEEEAKKGAASSAPKLLISVQFDDL